MKHAVIVLGMVLASAGPGLAAPIDFDHQIKPLLESRCADCHSGDARKGGLSLDTQAGLQQGGDSGQPALLAGDPDHSPLLQRVTSADPAKRMPPKGDPLTEAEVETLRAWIAEGAAWGTSTVASDVATQGSAHWAFQPPVASAPAQPGHPVDAFVHTAMQAHGLSPAPEADRATLIRRLSLDLRGLPPTPEEVAAFVADDRPDAWDRLVDAYLASPHHGERQAQIWLDAARYADTNGYEKDRHREIWPYRDWVINAFNSDLPYDRFIVEQVAGDLLPQATPDQRIATGFLRNSMLNEEGGVDVEEFRYEALVDRMNTTSTVVLGLTLGCAQCHTHKFDPFTQREYFQMLAFLDNTDDVDLTLEDAGIAEKRRGIEAEIAAMIADLPSQFPPGDLPADATEAALPEGVRRMANLAQQQAAWEAEIAPKTQDWTVLNPVAYTAKNHATFEKLDDGSLLMRGDIPNNDLYTVDYFVPVQGVTAIRLEALPHPSLPGGGPGRGVILVEGDFFLSEISAAAAPWSAPEALAPLTIQNPTQSYAGEGRAATLTLDGRADTGWSVAGQPGKPHAAVFEFSAPVRHEGGSLLRLTLDQNFIHQHTLGRFRVSATTGALPVQASGVPADVEQALHTPKAERSAVERDVIRDHFLSVTPALAEARAKIDALRATLPALPKTLVVAEREDPRETRVRNRGEFLSPRETVTPGVPRVLPPLPEVAPPNRLTFARWLVSEENPLAARVAMNRLWQTLFGRGLVDTPEDFGVRGSAPTHPELLDWLAVEFMRRGWSLKAMTQLIVTSATYRQASEATPELLEKDPANVWLARAPRFRVEAETVRDIALAASGLLNPQVGGPSVMLPLPNNLLNTVYTQGNTWDVAQGPDRYRRGIYAYIKRILPYPSLVTFDATARDATCVRRARSNTPLQALTLLNDPVFTEAATALSTRVLAVAAEDDARLRLAFVTCTAREPDAQEVEWMRAFVQRHRDTSGEAQAWFLLCRALLNLDETLTRT